MNAHLKTILLMAAFVCVASLIAVGMNYIPVFTIIVVSIFMFAAFYNLIYSLIKVEESIEQLKNKGSVKSSDLRRRLLETTSRQCLAEWDRAVLSSLIQSISLSIISALACRNTDEPRKGGATKRSAD